MSKFALLTSLLLIKETESANELQQIKQDLEQKFNGKVTDDRIHWQVGKSWNPAFSEGISVSYELTFRRNTHIGAFQENKARIERANSVLQSLANQYSGRIINVRPFTLATANDIVDRCESNGDEPYSEYEQSITGWIDIK